MNRGELPARNRSEPPSPAAAKGPSDVARSPRGKDRERIIEIGESGGILREWESYRIRRLIHTSCI